MRSSNRHNAQWRTILLALVIGIGLLGAEHQAHLSSAQHKLLLILFVVAFYAGAGLWAQARAAAAFRAETRRRAPVIISVVTPSPHDRTGRPALLPQPIRAEALDDPVRQ